MQTSEILAKFELYTDDNTELSTQEELDLLNKVYYRVCNNRPWEWLKKAFTGTQSTTVPYIALPSDFVYLSSNNDWTDNTTAVSNNATPRVVFVGSDYSPCQIINFSDRRQYRNSDGYAYIDIPNSRLVFTKQPTTANAVEFDYISRPLPLVVTVADPLIEASTPVFPIQFHDILVHGMATDDYIIQIFDKARSYENENQREYMKYLVDMSYYNAQLQNN